MNAKSAYSEKLRDPRWQKKRLEVLNRDEWKCQDCGAADKTLHVHHCLYIYGLDPWNYAADELRTLCEECHEARPAMEHDAVLEFKRFLARKNGNEIAQIMWSLCAFRRGGGAGPVFADPDDAT